MPVALSVAGHDEQQVLHRHGQPEGDGDALGQRGQLAVLHVAQVEQVGGHQILCLHVGIVLQQRVDIAVQLIQCGGVLHVLIGPLQRFLDGGIRRISLAVRRHDQVALGIGAVLEGGGDDLRRVLVLRAGRKRGHGGHGQRGRQQQSQEHGCKLLHFGFPFLTFVINLRLLQKSIALGKQFSVRTASILPAPDTASGGCPSGRWTGSPSGPPPAGRHPHPGWRQGHGPDARC